MKESKATHGTAPHVGPDPHAPMFGTLLASSPDRQIGQAAQSLLGSIIVHGLIIVALVWATMTSGQELSSGEEFVLIELPPETPPLPPPPPPMTAAPEAPALDVAMGFQTLTVPEVVPPDIPPPGTGVRIDELDFSGQGVEGGRAAGSEGGPPQTDLALAPVFTPMTVRPELLNAPEVQRALVRTYPPILRDAGIGGTTVMWFFIDETGTVLRTQLSTSSGHDALDEVATKVAHVMKFSPAFNRDRRVRVWVEIPIVFTAH